VHEHRRDAVAGGIATAGGVTGGIRWRRVAAASGGQIGGEVSVWTAWGGNELKTFQNVLQPFKDQTGIEVKITTVRDAAQLAINVKPARRSRPRRAPTADKIAPGRNRA
jgi:ABC-type glycerol-3-phosphate transport system substrate-binding protein